MCRLSINIPGDEILLDQRGGLNIMKHKYSTVEQYKPKYINYNDPTPFNYLELAAAM